MDREVTSGGNPSYKGYEYQKEVTAWIALTLFLDCDKPRVNDIIIEPASEEDIEAKLLVSPEDAMANIIVPQPDKLTVQIKYRSSGYLSCAAFVSLLKDAPKKGASGPSPRPRAKSLLLSDPSRLYVLITNIGVDVALSEGRIERVDQRPPPNFLPAGLTREGREKDALAGRFAVVENLTPKVLKSELRRILEEVGHVPSPSVENAIADIKRAVSDRLLGLALPLSMRDIEAILQSAGGLPQGDRELSEYIPPISADSARTILSQKDAVLLVGPSGYGKTLTAKQLVMEHRLANPPFEVVRQSSGIEGIDAYLVAPGRHIFYLDDPWGQSKLEPNADRWSIELPKLLHRASPDKKFVITSRIDILRLAFVGMEDAPWKEISCYISKESYDDNIRWAIVERKLESAGSWRLDFARQYRAKLLRDLQSPHALDRFARGLLDTVSPQKALLYDLVEQAQTESIRRIVTEQVKGWASHGVSCAAILWSLFYHGGKTNPAKLKAIRRSLARNPIHLELNLEEFVAHLKVMSLNEDKSGLLSAHGKVVEALEQVVTHHQAESERALNKALLAYEQLGKEDGSYQTEMLRLIAAVNSVKTSHIDFDIEERCKADTFLLERLSSATRRNFPTAFRDVAGLASEKPVLARFVRYLANGDPTLNKRIGFEALGWHPPKLKDAEIKLVRSESLCQKVARKFVEWVLPHESESYDADHLLKWLQPFGFDLSESFLKACQFISTYPGFLINSDTVVFSAIMTSELPPYDEIFSAIEILEASVAEVQKKQEFRDPWQGEMDFALQLHQQDELEDEGSAVSHAVKGYVTARRFREGYGWILPHRRSELIMPAWAEAMTFGTPNVTVEEIGAFLAAANTPWMRARGLRVIGEKKIEAAVMYLLSALEKGSPQERTSAIRALRWLYDQDHVEDMICAAMGNTELIGQLDLFLASGELTVSKSDKAAMMERIWKRAPIASQAVLEMLTVATIGAPSDDILEKFRQIDTDTVNVILQRASLPVARFSLSISAHEGHDITEVATRWLASDNVEDVLAAVDALRHIGTLKARQHIATVADHKDYKVRREVINALSAKATDEEEKLILARAYDRSAPVREKVAEIIGDMQWKSGLELLLHLLRDRRDYTRHPEYNIRVERDYKVARTAAKSLHRFKPLPSDVVDKIIAFVEAGQEASSDVELHVELVNVLASVPDSRVVIILCKLLDDDRVVGGKGENLYPVRYSAGWALCHHIHSFCQKDEAKFVDWDAVERGTLHADPQLAAPCLCLLGMQLTNPTPRLLTALRSKETSETRRVLALLMMDDFSVARENAMKYGLLSDTHPFLAHENPSAANDWPVTKPLEIWLRNLDKYKDVEGVVLKIAASHMKIDLDINDFDATALRRTTKTPITTTSEMFGME